MSRQAQNASSAKIDDLLFRVVMGQLNPAQAMSDLQSDQALSARWEGRGAHAELLSLAGDEDSAAAEMLLLVRHVRGRPRDLLSDQLASMAGTVSSTAALQVLGVALQYRIPDHARARLLANLVRNSSISDWVGHPGAADTARRWLTTKGLQCTGTEEQTLRKFVARWNAELNDQRAANLEIGRRMALDDLNRDG